MVVGKSEPRVPTEIEFGEEQEFEAYEAIVLKRALANSRLSVTLESTAEIIKQNTKLTAIKHEQEQEAIIEGITIESILDLVEKDRKKVEFFLSDLTKQKESLEKTIVANRQILETSANEKPDEDVATVERLMTKWIEVVDLLESKVDMLNNAIKVRDQESVDFRDKLQSNFEQAPLMSDGIKIEVEATLARLPIDDIYIEVCNQGSNVHDAQQLYLDCIERMANLFAINTKPIVLDHFSERGSLKLT